MTDELIVKLGLLAVSVLPGITLGLILPILVMGVLLKDSKEDPPASVVRIIITCLLGSTLSAYTVVNKMPLAQKEWRQLGIYVDPASFLVPNSQIVILFSAATSFLCFASLLSLGFIFGNEDD